MDFSIKQIRADGAKSAAIIVGMYDGGKFAPAAKAVDRASSGYLTALHRRGDLKATGGACTVLHAVPSVRLVTDWCAPTMRRASSVMISSVSSSVSARNMRADATASAASLRSMAVPVGKPG